MMLILLHLMMTNILIEVKPGRVVAEVGRQVGVLVDVDVEKRAVGIVVAAVLHFSGSVQRPESVTSRVFSIGVEETANFVKKCLVC